MPAKNTIKRTHCRIDGCPHPPHVYPSGMRSCYCKNHIRLRKGKQRGKENITYPMECVLRRLRAALEQDAPFLLLDPAQDRQLDERTLFTLAERDWIVEGDVTESYYRITKRGLNILAKCDVQVQRRDGICPKCGERPKRIDDNGRQLAYCDECERERTRLKTLRQRKQTPTEPCAHCYERPRHQYQPSGTWSRYCSVCDPLLRKGRKHTTAKERRERIRRGEMPIPVCAECKDRPVVLYENSVSHYCAVCLPKVARRWKVKRMYERIRPGATA